MRATACVMAVVTYLLPGVLTLDEVAHAAPIVDPRAPIPFQPAITQTSTGIPAVNIAAPNANGISVNSYQSFNIDSNGLVLNNSLTPGTPLLGGTLGANPNLAGRAASVIVNQVTTTGPASTLVGPLEVFGSPASLIISNPNGVSVNGLSLTNATGLVLTTGTPQFLTGVGGASTDFAHAGSLAYNVTSGSVSINGPAGVNGPGVGIEGTVGNIDVIAQTISLNAPLRADQRINLVTGNQLVSPTASDASGTNYGTAANGAANTAAAIGNNAVAIDANQFGSVTSGQIYIVSTAAGMGVNTQGALTATAGNISVTSSGDIAAGQTVANQNIGIASAGSTTITAAGLANQNYTVTAGGDINVSGSVSAGQNVSLGAGGNLSATSTAATGSANLTAGGSMTLGTVSAQSVALQTATGDLTVNSTVSSPGAISANAGRDLTVNGAVQGGSTVQLSAARNANVNGILSGVGNTSVTATTGNASIAGNVQTNGTFTVSAAQGVTLGGTVQAQGPVSVTAQNGALNGSGNIASSQGSVTLDAGGNIGLTGSLQSATTLSATAGGNANLGGTLTAPGAISVTTGQDATIGGNATSGSTLTVNAGGNATVQGAAASVGDMSLSANGGTLGTTGSVTTTGALTASGQQGVSLGGTVYSQGNAQISSSAGGVAVGGTLTSPGTIGINAAQDATVTGLVHGGQSAIITATRDANLNGGLQVDGTGNATVSAGRDINGTGAVNVANNATLSAGRNIGVSGAIQTGNNLSATAGTSLSVGPTTAVGTETLTATNGSATLTGNALSGGNMAVSAGTNVSAQGTVESLGNLNVNASSGNLTTAAAVQAAGSGTLNAGQNMTLGGQTTVSGDATLTGNNITTQGLAVGGNLVATATNSLDTSAGQLNAAFNANAPALSVTGSATLNAANVTTANAAISGTYSATGTTSLTTGGTAAYQGNATLAGGTVTNVGTQEAAGNLTVSGSTIANQGVLSALQTMAVTAANLNNSGSIYGPTTNINVAGNTTNTGGLLATNALTLTTGSLNNSNGLIFSGDVKNPASATGNTNVTVTGGNGSFNNTNGQILAYQNTTLTLPNQMIDPSAGSFGTVNGGSALNLSVQAVNNSGTWTLPGTAVTVTASQGINNAGTINQGTGTLALNGAVNNSGTVTAKDLTINGSVVNQTNATVQANDALTINGSGTNTGIVEAANTLTISGSSYNNSNGTTKAGNASSPSGSGNLNINLTGDLGNTGGTLAATNDIAITANNVNNSTASSSTTTTTTTTTVINNPALVMSLVVGTDTADLASLYGGENGFCCTITQTPQTVTLADALSPAGLATSTFYLTGSPPVATSGSVTFVEIGGQWFVQTSQNAGTGTATRTVALPVATETTTTTGGQASSAPSVIAAGHNLNLTANSLGNQGGTVSAGNDVNLNVQSLSNGGSTYSSTVTDTVDTASINSFLSQAPSTIQIWSNFYGPNALGPYTVGAYIDPAGIQLNAPGTVTPLSTSSSVTVQGTTGQIVAGHNLNLSGGNLTNAGTLAAANDVNITASSFTNQGANTGTMTTTAGCASGYSAGCSSLSTTNPNSQTYSYQQTNSTVTAGNDIVIAANTVSNTYGTLAARRNVVIGGAGTTASDTSATPTNLTQAASVTNTSGSIAAGNDANISAATLTNTIAAPVQVHQNYGSATPFTGCTSNCEAYVDVQSAAPSTITANHNVNLTAGSFSNTGSLITALNNVTINASGSASSANQYLNAYWSSGFTHYGTPYATWGCANNPSLCGTLYGSAYSSSAAQDPAGLPSSVGLPGFVPATIQAGNTLSVNSPTLTNTGNVIGQTVALSGSQLVNGLTNPHVYTPPPAVSGQVISLGPLSVPASATTTINGAGLVTTLAGQPTSVTGAAGLPSNTPIGVQTVGKPVPPVTGTTPAPQSVTVQTSNGQKTVTVSYLASNPAAQVMGDITPASLLANLPANLQPASVPFYYDPYTEDQQIEQAALQATGKSSFYSTTSAADSTSQTSIDNQDKAALYGAALQYAKQNNVALGTQLSQAQLALIDAPMLWYTEETVPEPGCTATGNGACPTVQTLMPEVLLPQNYASVRADGEITGTNVSLNYANSILNTGSISADNLTVNTGTLTNEERSTNIGTIYQDVGVGVEKTTGTVVQQGGFMSAMNYDMNAQAIDNVGGAIQQVNADGSLNQAATSQMLANLKSQLGNQFTQSTVSNNLNSTLIADGGMGPLQVFQMVMLVAISVVTAGAGTGAAIAGFTAGTAEAAAANAAFAALVSSLAGQAMNGQFSLKSIAESVAIAAVTAGLTNGVTFDSNTGSLGFNLTQNISQLPQGVSTLGQLAGVAPGAGTTVAQSAASVAGNLPQQALAIGAEATLQAGVQSAIGGGSFLANLKNDAVSDVAAAGAYDIGTAFNGQPGSLGAPNASDPAYVLAHAALGCASSAALGSGCAGGAIGGSTSALISPFLVDQAGGAANLTDADRATITAIAMLTGGTAAGLLGQNATTAMTAAENEAQNNSELTHNAGLTPLGGLVAQVCGASNPPCSDSMVQTLVNAQAQNAAMALPMIGATIGYGLPAAALGVLSPAMLLGGALGFAFDYGGDLFNNIAFGMSAPNFQKSYFVGAFQAAATPLLIGEMGELGLGGKIGASIYNGSVGAAASYGGAAMADPNSAGLAAQVGGSTAVAGNLVKGYLPPAVGEFVNQLIQSTAGPIQGLYQHLSGQGK
ncbi:filamentous hemagglutinin N-terminal domain-containing protein [Paraburkholderia fungorum]|uniref:beta strand repeat-containing protein n=1 Tax=Paraburkholderia fungorum TaxID=134537 RepID=UPI00217CCB7D|nr:filamentous hemagglutinin N-terminal domain-containing protein [Paraburkholderia fungorum]